MKFWKLCVTEIMNQKIFPVVINSGIYKPAIRAEYVKYWQKEYEDLNNSLQGIKIQNIGRLGDDLKRAQNISANVAEFLVWYQI